MTATPVPMRSGDRRPMKPSIATSLAAAPRVGDWVGIAEPIGAPPRWLIRSGKIEFGQGIHAALIQVAASALAVSPDEVRCDSVSTERSPDEGTTSGSRSLEDSGSLIAAACATLRRSAAERAAPGGSTRLIDSVMAEDFEQPIDPRFVDSAFRGDWIGRRVARPELPARLFGEPTYVHDLTLPAMVHARVLRGAHHRSAPANLAELRALLPATVHWFDDGRFAALWSDDEDLLTRTWRRCREKAIWTSTRRGCGDAAPLAAVDPNDPAWLTSAESETSVLVDTIGDPAGAASANGDRPPAASQHDASAVTVPRAVRRAVYTRPYLSHASIGPSCAVAAPEGGRLVVWTHSQAIHTLRRELANALGLEPAAVTVHHREGAGCYGHNGADDVAFDAALLAVRLQRPVRVQWMREDEFSCAPSGPATVVRIEAALDDRQRIAWWRSDAWGPGHHSRPGGTGSPRLLGAWQFAGAFPETMPVNLPIAIGGGGERNALPIYDVGARRIAVHRILEPPVRSSSLRSLGALANVFAIESFMDELALGAGADPVAFRLAHLRDERAIELLSDVVDRSPWRDWRRAPPADHGVGCGLARYKGSSGYCAVVACVAVTHEVRVLDLYLSVDVGTVVSPDGVAHQVEGGAIQATSWALKESVRFDRAGMASQTWGDYPILGFTEVPRVHVHAIDRAGLPALGAGEIAQGPTVAAIANALHHALGARVRDLPMTFDRIAATIQSSNEPELK